MAQVLVVKWRHAGMGWSRSSASTTFPSVVNPRKPVDQVQVEAVCKSVMALLARHLQEPFSLSLLNVGGTNFASAAQSSRLPAVFGRARAAIPPAPAAAPAPGSSAAATASETQRRDYGAQPSALLMSKAAERSLREAVRLGADQDGGRVPSSITTEAQDTSAWPPPPSCPLPPRRLPAPVLQAQADCADDAVAGRRGMWKPDTATESHDAFWKDLQEARRRSASPDTAAVPSTIAGHDEVGQLNFMNISGISPW